MSAADSLAPDLTEKVFQTRVVELCRWHRLKVFHSGDSRRDLCAGFPDLVIVGPGGVLFVELKTDKGRVRPDQTDWLLSIALAGGRGEVWRPRDWPAIQRALRDLSIPSTTDMKGQP